MDEAKVYFLWITEGISKGLANSYVLRLFNAERSLLTLQIFTIIISIVSKICTDNG